jgi:hypothetical protein
MNAPKAVEVSIKTDQGKKPARSRNPDTVPEGAPFHEQMQPPSKVGPFVLDNPTFEAFADGAGI